VTDQENYKRLKEEGKTKIVTNLGMKMSMDLHRHRKAAAAARFSTPVQQLGDEVLDKFLEEQTCDDEDSQ
jgi:hypothetical protein